MLDIGQQQISPFVGPRPFNRDLEDQKLFFGRICESEKIISLIYSHKLVLVYAQSGAGKTSIFTANIIPALEQKGLQVLPIIRVGIGSGISNESVYGNTSINMQSDAINGYILNTFQSLVPDIDDLNSLLVRSKKEGALAYLSDNHDHSPKTMSLYDFLKQHFPHKINQRGKPIPQIIIFDQLEEIFIFYSDPYKWSEHQKDFFNQIAEALESDPLLRIVFVIREDYLAQLDPFAGMLPEKLKPRFRLERLHKEDALLAIKGPDQILL
jgi:hypothetical protein